MFDKKTCCKQMYPSHDKEMPRLNRVSGQIDGVKKMIAERRYCPEIIQQIRAVRSALRAVENNILQSHLESCVADSFSNKKERVAKIAEIRELLDRSQC